MCAPATHRLPFAASTPRLVRAELSEFLNAHGCADECLAHALLVVSELIANAVQHGTPDEDGQMEIAWGLEGRELLLSVRDAGKARPFEPRDAGHDATSGRGLTMIDRVARAWTVDHSDGTRVSARIHLD